MELTRYFKNKTKSYKKQMEIQEVQQIVKMLGGIRKAGRKIGLSASTLCEYLKGKHPRNRKRIEGVFEQYVKQVECPVLGRITREECGKWHNKPFVATNSFNVKMYRACKGCLQGLLNEEKE